MPILVADPDTSTPWDGGELDAPGVIVISRPSRLAPQRKVTSGVGYVEDNQMLANDM